MKTSMSGGLDKKWLQVVAKDPGVKDTVKKHFDRAVHQATIDAKTALASDKAPRRDPMDGHYKPVSQWLYPFGVRTIGGGRWGTTFVFWPKLGSDVKTSSRKIRQGIKSESEQLREIMKRSAVSSGAFFKKDKRRS